MKHLVIAVHPDDETLGCGGTLLRCKAEGHSIHWCIVTKASENVGFSSKTVALQQETVERVHHAYPFDTVHWFDFPPARLDTIPLSDLIGAVGNVIREIAPDTVYLPFWADAHSDHACVFEAAWSCCKVFRYPSVRKVLCMETPSETDFATPYLKNAFIPSVFIDISTPPPPPARTM